MGNVTIDSFRDILELQEKLKVPFEIWYKEELESKPEKIVSSKNTNKILENITDYYDGSADFYLYKKGIACMLNEVKIEMQNEFHSSSYDLNRDYFKYKALENFNLKNIKRVKYTLLKADI